MNLPHDFFNRSIKLTKLNSQGSFVYYIDQIDQSWNFRLFYFICTAAGRLSELSCRNPDYCCYIIAVYGGGFLSFRCLSFWKKVLQPMFLWASSLKYIIPFRTYACSYCSSLSPKDPLLNYMIFEIFYLSLKLSPPQVYCLLAFEIFSSTFKIEPFGNLNNIW